MTDRGVSEVMGFVLVFTLMTGVIGVVYATGISGLHDTQEEEKFTNVERAFDVLADNVEDIHQRGAPSRATEVKLAGGSMAISDTVTIKVRAVNQSNPQDNVTYQINSQSIIYEDDGGGKLVYAGGAVLRSQSTGATMLHEPNWITGSDRSVIPLINTYGSDAGGVAGGGKVLIVAEKGARSIPPQFETGGGSRAEVNVTVTSSRVGAWQRFFEDEGYTAIDPNTNNNNVTYQFHTDSIFVPRTGIEITFDR